MSPYPTPNLVVMRISQPAYECAAWPILDASDAVLSLEKETEGAVTHASYTPTLVLPQYVNEVFIGETLNLSVLVSNSNKTPCTNVKFRVEIVPEDADEDPVAIEPFVGITLEPHRRPQQTTISHLFRRQSPHRMTFTITFNVGKKNFQVVKRAIWEVVNPIRFHFVVEKDSNGRTHMETVMTNVSKLVLTVTDIKLLVPEDSSVQECLAQPNEHLNGICALAPNNSHSVVFRNISTTKRMRVKITWHSYQRGTGEFVIPVELLDPANLIAYETVKHPGTVQARQEFTIVIKVTNLRQEALQCRLKFHEKELRPLIAQIDDYLDFGKMLPNESRLVEVPLMSLTSGFHMINGLEIHVHPNVIVPITDLQVLAI